MPEASPTKWHLAHTSWFFETFVLSAYLPERPPFHRRFGYLGNREPDRYQRRSVGGVNAIGSFLVVIRRT